MINFIKKIIQVLKTRKYNGWLYPAIGSRFEYTNRNHEIEFNKAFTWYSEWFDIFIYIPFMLKVYIPDKKPKFNRNTIIKLYNRNIFCKLELYNFNTDKIIHSILINPLDDNSWDHYIMQNILGYILDEEKFYMLSFYNVKDDYIGSIDDAVWLLRNNIFSPQPALDSDGKICSIGLIIENGLNKSWVGWSHRASYSFKVGDALFDPEATIDDYFKLYPYDEPYDMVEKIPFNKRGKKKCITMMDCKFAASNFAKDVS
jgi:hypothetical protein